MTTASPLALRPVYHGGGYAISFIVSITAHTLLLGLLFFGWQFQSKITQTDRPAYVQARLVQMTAQSAISKPAPAKEVVEIKQPEPEIIRPLQRDVEKAAVEKKNQLKLKQEKLKQEKLKQEKLQQQKLLEEKNKREALEKAARDKALADKRKADEALAREMAAEDALQQSLSDKVLAESYADRIRRRVEQNWSRPLSAQKGMEVLLEIQLVPTGYVNGVSVLRSSGNPAFDQSALQAVNKAERFPEIKEVPPRVFEQHFRRFKMLFRVEDAI